MNKTKLLGVLDYLYKLKPSQMNYIIFGRFKMNVLDSLIDAVKSLPEEWVSKFNVPKRDIVKEAQEIFS
jgi:hypothetical protein